MASVNRVMLLGNLTRDPQLTYTPNQTAVVDFGMAMNRKWTGEDGAKHEDVCFVDCRAFGKVAEIVNKYVIKGQLLFAEGRLSFEQWDAKEGGKRSKLRVTVERVQLMPAPAEKPGEAGSMQPDPNEDIPF